MKRRIEIDLEFFEDLIAYGRSLQACALDLGLQPATLYHRLNTDPACRAAQQRGLVRLAASRRPEFANAVLIFLKTKPETRASLKVLTSFTYSQIEQALYELQYVRRWIRSDENGLGIDVFSVIEATAERPKKFRPNAFRSYPVVRNVADVPNGFQQLLER